MHVVWHLVMVTHVVSSQSAGCVMFGMLVGSLSATISAGRMGEQVYSKKMDTLREFFKVRDAKVLRRFWFHAFAHPGIRTLCSYGPFALTDVTYCALAFFLLQTDEKSGFEDPQEDPCLLR